MPEIKIEFHNRNIKQALQIMNSWLRRAFNSDQIALLQTNESCCGSIREAERTSRCLDYETLSFQASLHKSKYYKHQRKHHLPLCHYSHVEAHSTQNKKTMSLSPDKILASSSERQEKYVRSSHFIEEVT